MRRLLLASVVALVAGAAASLALDASGAAPAGRWVIRDLGTLGGASSEAWTVNERGQVVGTSGTGRGEVHAFLWQEGTMRDLGTLGGRGSFASDIDERGRIVGCSSTGGANDRELDYWGHPFLWENNEMTNLAPDRHMGCAYDINMRGEIALTIGSKDSWHAAVWTGAKIRSLGFGKFPVAASQANWINDRGEILGFGSTLNDIGDDHVFFWRSRGASMSFLGQGFAVALNERGQVLIGEVEGEAKARVWHNGVVTPLGDPSGRRMTPYGWRHSEVAAMNDGGMVVGTDFSPRVEARAVLWSRGRMRSLGTLGGHTSHAVAINNSGRVVGRSSVSSDGDVVRAFVWGSGHMTELPTLDGLNSEAISISDRGWIVGNIVTRPRTATAPRQTHAVVWTWQPRR